MTEAGHCSQQSVHRNAAAAADPNVGGGPADAGRATGRVDHGQGPAAGRRSRAGAWLRAGAVSTLSGINVFTSQSAGGSRLHPLPEPAIAPTAAHRTSRQRRVKKNGNWSNQQLQQALAAVDEGKSIKKAALENHIPYTSLCDWCYGRTRSRKRGVKAVLTQEEEAQLVQYLIAMCDRGYGLSPSALKMKVYEITKTKSTPFKDGIPGAGWMRWFRRRHPELSIRSAQGLETARAQALCPENVESLYNNLSELYSLHNYPPERIWNCDESGAQAGMLHTPYPCI